MPQSPGKRVQASPDVKLARGRLDDLLHGLQTRTSQSSSAESEFLLGSPNGALLEQCDSMDTGDPFEFSDDNISYKTPSSARRNLLKEMKQEKGTETSHPVKKREKKVVFELRGKPFELRDQNSDLSIFSLCRAWTRGKDGLDLVTDDEPMNELDVEPPEDTTLDLLATKEIYSMPRPHPDPLIKMPVCPELIPREADLVDVNSRQGLLDSHVPHWRTTRNSWVEHSKERDVRFAKSLNLLETVFNIAQQNQIS